MKPSEMIGILAVAVALAFGACEQNPPSASAERGGTTSAPTSRGASGEASPRAGASGSSGMASSPSSMDQSGTGGSGDAGFGGRDGGMR